MSTGTLASVVGGAPVVLVVVGVAVAGRLALGALRARRTSSASDEAAGGARSSAPAKPEPVGGRSRSATRPGGSAGGPGEVLVVRDLTVSYGATRAVDALCFGIGRSEIFGLLGPNGAGKTSTLSVIEGLVRPRAGLVLVDGIDVLRQPTEARAKLGVQLQATSFQDELTITQIVRLYAGLYGVALSDHEIRDHLVNIGLGGHSAKPFKQLSGGQQQRLSLFIALIHDPALLLLDEPTSGLDPQSRRQLWSRIERIRDTGGSILLTTHSMEEAQAVCDRVAIIDRGRLLATGEPRTLIEQHRDDPLVRAAAHGDVTLEDVFIGLTGAEIRE
jgi:ABC-2 type transport system ATP-binding protein